MQIRRYRDDDWPEWLRMSLLLDPASPQEAHELDMHTALGREDAAVFVVERPNGKLAGYVEVGARSYADGCSTSPVGYIEAWFVDDDVRRAGLGRELLDVAETWSRSQGYREMASDALIDNEVSYLAHVGAGYEVVDRVVQFRKSLTNRSG
jgi:aminoglycoside 6'-N-acetyltransferase I